MSTWEVELRSQEGELRAHRRVRCRSDVDAEALAALPEIREGSVHLFRVRARRRTLHSVRYIGTDGDGLAGVREPRRPLPEPGHLRAAREF